MSLVAAVDWVGDGLILLGAVVITLGVIGIYRMPGIYMKLHAASKSVFLGVCAILVGVVETGDAQIIARAAALEENANEEIVSPQLTNPETRGRNGPAGATVFGPRR